MRADYEAAHLKRAEEVLAEKKGLAGRTRIRGVRGAGGMRGDACEWGHVYRHLPDRTFHTFHTPQTVQTNRPSMFRIYRHLRQSVEIIPSIHTPSTSWISLQPLLATVPLIPLSSKLVSFSKEWLAKRSRVGSITP
jgi:hypothetical protein